MAPLIPGPGHCFCRVILSCPEGSWPKATFLVGSKCHRERKHPLLPVPSTAVPGQAGFSVTSARYKQSIHLQLCLGSTASGTLGPSSPVEGGSKGSVLGGEERLGYREHVPGRWGHCLQFYQGEGGWAASGLAVRRVRALAAKPNNLRFILGTHMGEREN